MSHTTGHVSALLALCGIAVLLAPPALADHTLPLCEIDPYAPPHVHAQHAEAHADPDVEFWLKARADYLRNIDYSYLFSDDPRRVWPTRKALIEARHLLAQAQADAIPGFDAEAARETLQRALAQLREAQRTEPVHRATLRDLIDRITALSLTVDQVSCWTVLPGRVFEDLGLEIEALVDAPPPWQAGAP